MSVPGAGPLLERDDPLDALRQAMVDAEHSSGRAILVSGEPGIGKTALVTHFASLEASHARVLIGICDNLITKRPLSAFRDITQQISQAPFETADSPQGFGDFVDLLIQNLRMASRPTLMIIEDAHWADEATVDVLTVLARRISGLPVVLIITLRPGELDAEHPLSIALDSMQRTPMRHVELAPLSRKAVEQLAGPQTEHIFHLSGGNPFFVTELLVHGTDPAPPSLANVVLSRTIRLGKCSRELLELVSVVPGRLAIAVVERLHPEWDDALEAAQRAQLLNSDADYVWFRHELTRNAIHDSISPRRRRKLHKQLLADLLAQDAEPADVVHHAEAAGAKDIVAEYALIAARQAARVSSNREALEHYRRAADFAEGRLDPGTRADLSEELAQTALLTGHLDVALDAITNAIEFADQLDDTVQHGRCKTLRSRLHWFLGNGAHAWDDAQSSIRRLKTVDAPVQLAAAYAQAAELSMLTSNTTRTQYYGQSALALAGNDSCTRLQALSALGMMRLQLDVNDVSVVRQAIQAATDAGQPQATISLLLKGHINLLWCRPEVVSKLIARGLPIAREHQYDALTTLFERLSAWLAARRGDFETAMQLTQLPTGRRNSVRNGRLIAHTVQAEVALRRGDPDASDQLQNLGVEVDRTGELCRIEPVLELQIEQALLTGEPPPVERIQEAVDRVGQEALRQGCGAARFAAWAQLCGIDVPFSGDAPAPHRYMLVGDWRKAAEAFGSIGWDYDQALMLSLVDDGEALNEAMLIARWLGAHPLEQRVAQRLRTLNLPVPHGPRDSTRTNPYGLTNRQLEVLNLLRQGADNAQIARRLHISPRTVEHHVTAIFTKLQVTSRAEAMAYSWDIELP